MIKKITMAALDAMSGFTDLRFLVDVNPPRYDFSEVGRKFVDNLKLLISKDECQTLGCQES